MTLIEFLCKIEVRKCDDFSIELLKASIMIFEKSSAVWILKNCCVFYNNNIFILNLCNLFMKKIVFVLSFVMVVLSLTFVSAVEIDTEWHVTGSLCWPPSNGWVICIDYLEKYFIFWDNAENNHYLVTDILHATLYDPNGNERDTETYF